METPTKYALYVCQRGGRFSSQNCTNGLGWQQLSFRVELDDTGMPPLREDGRVQVSCDLPRDHYENGHDAGTWAVLCPRCGSPDTTNLNRNIRGRVGKNACEAICQTATGTTCNCSCGGTEHGVRS